LTAAALAAACDAPAANRSDWDADLGTSSPPPDPATDMGTQPPSGTDLARAGSGGPVGPRGGTVDLLHFGLSGDTRPPACEDTAHYPTPIIQSIADHIAQQNAQFALDLGDHMYVCNDSVQTATAQMDLFVGATRRFPGTWFMTEGNHECWKGPCVAGMPGVNDANYAVFMQALAPISQTPYYSFDVQTSLGLATFVVIADNSWSNAQQSWLEQTLATADAKAKYTIVARHHPTDDSTVATNPLSLQIVRAHKFALLLTGHSHLYKHTSADGGRVLVMGNSGAPLIVGGTFYGYAIVDQLATGMLKVSVYDINAQSPVDAWTVGPN
jgi:hypothetical protein